MKYVKAYKIKERKKDYGHAKTLLNAIKEIQIFKVMYIV